MGHSNKTTNKHMSVNEQIWIGGVIYCAGWGAHEFKKTSKAGNCSRFRPLWCQPLTERWQVMWHPSWQTKNCFRMRNGKTWHLELHHLVSKAVYRLARDESSSVDNKSHFPCWPSQSMTGRIHTHQDLEAIIPLDRELFDIITCGKVNLTIQFWSLRKKRKQSKQSKQQQQKAVW